MLNYILKPVRHENFHNKYASGKYFKASTFCRDWALQRWEENSIVDLEAQLDVLKDDAEARRVMMEQEHAALQEVEEAQE